MSTATAITGIGQIAIIVHDLDRATAFYRDLLGLRLLFQIPKMSFFDVGGIRLMLSLPETAELDHPSSILYFRVSDLHGAHAQMAGRGVAFESDPSLVAAMADHDLWMAFFRDSEGNIMSLMSEVRRESVTV